MGGSAWLGGRRRLGDKGLASFRLPGRTLGQLAADDAMDVGGGAVAVSVSQFRCQAADMRMSGTRGSWRTWVEGSKAVAGLGRSTVVEATGLPQAEG